MIPGRVSSTKGMPQMVQGPEASAAILRTNVPEQSAPMPIPLLRFHRRSLMRVKAANDCGEFLKKPLPERLAYQQTHLEARLEQVKTVRAAVEKLYAKLSGEQKQAADEIVLPMMGMGMGRSGFGPGMMFR
jgi:hypothetical protein